MFDRCLILLILLTFLPGTVAAQDERSKAYDYLNRRGEVNFTFAKPQKNFLLHLSSKLSIDNISADSVYANANAEEFERFLKTGIPFKVTVAPGEIYHPKHAKSGDWDYYPTYSEYVTLMQNFESTYPQLCSLFSIGKSVQNKDLWFLKISSNINSSEDKPKFMYSSSMHGDETVGFVLMLRLIDYLLTNYGTDERITRLVDEIEIYINPLFNPDGAYFGGDGTTITSPIRRNANNKDLNRNYPDAKAGPNPDGPYQPETIAMMAFLDTMTVTMSANFHGGAEVVNFPWDTWVARHADHNWFRNVSKEYADTAQFYSPAGYLTSINPQGFVKGSDWYVIEGGQQDFITYFAGGREVTVEISNTKFPSGANLPDFWEYNYRSFLNYMEQSIFGLRGKVTDSYTGLPLQAKIEFLEHDIDSSWTFSNSKSGNYFRPAAGGVYSVKFSSFGYKDTIINSVQLFEKQTTLLDMQLEPNKIFPLNDTISIVPNPVKTEGEIRVFIHEKASISVDIFDYTGKKLSGTKPREYETGEIVFNLNIRKLSPGLNLVRVKINNNYFTKKLLFLPE
jgi:hypothetical protein